MISDPPKHFMPKAMQDKLRPPFDLLQMPAGIAQLPKDGRGYPIPWFVDMRAPQIKGNPDFRVMDGHRLVEAVKGHLCWICGQKIQSPLATFVAGPMCGINRTSQEPPSHHSCAVWAARACPFLNTPKRVRDDQDLPEGHVVSGEMIARNPGVTMLWVCETFRPFPVKRSDGTGGGVLFQMGEPSLVVWYAEGRAATHEEVMESVESGLPLLLRAAAEDGALACFELGRAAERFHRFVPAQEPL